MTPTTWEEFMLQEREKPYFAPLMEYVKQEYQQGTCYPPYENIFTAFNLTPLDRVQVVILGQDPYHEPNQAHGLCFSVLPTQPKLPPSLRNIYKELTEEYGSCKRPDGCLTDWAGQGVLLLNTVLTVREHAANSHRGQGWETFTDNALRLINTLDRPIVYLLWGAPARKKAALITNQRHLILKAAHPSPLSAYRGFFGCNHFIECNKFLKNNGINEINWTKQP